MGIEGHATLVVDRRGSLLASFAYSIDKFNKSYLAYSQEFGYFDWLHWAAARDPDKRYQTVHPICSMDAEWD
jgi:hypothetical protein